MEILVQYKTNAITDFTIHIPVEAMWAGLSMMLDDVHVSVEY